MLPVGTRFDRSPIHGLDLFADEPIPEGTDVWRLDVALRDIAPGEELTVDDRLLTGSRPPGGPDGP